MGCFGGHWLVRPMWVINMIIDTVLRPNADIYFLRLECGKRCGSEFQGICQQHTY